MVHILLSLKKSASSRLFLLTCIFVYVFPLISCDFLFFDSRFPIPSGNKSILAHYPIRSLSRVVGVIDDSKERMKGTGWKEWQEKKYCIAREKDDVIEVSRETLKRGNRMRGRETNCGGVELNFEIYRVNNRALIYDSMGTRKLSYDTGGWEGERTIVSPFCFS